MDCIFCKIGTGEIPSHRVYEDKSCLAFLDIHPHAKGHTVVIPKEHFLTLFDLSDAQVKELIIGIKKSMEILQKKLNSDGFNVGWNHNTAGGQVVPHLHIHILPRYINDGGGSMQSIIRNPGDVSVEEVAKLFQK